VTPITCYLDFISPYAYLAFEALPQALQGLNQRVIYKPVLFAGLLKHHGQLGPAEIAGKRDWTYRQVLWQARAHGVPLDLPQAHPFNPLGLLRLSLACEAEAPHTGEVSRYVCERIFHHVWRGGAAADDAGRLAELTQALAPAHSPDAPEVKAALKANTDAAIALGLFGVPSFVVDGQVFWGLDALPLLRAFLDGDQFFDGPWQQAARVTQGVRR
jgi:2-hydroxychromene-2-carboxylate isomerase